MGLLDLSITSGEFIGESLDLCFEGVDPLSLLFEDRLEFVDPLGQQSVLLCQIRTTPVCVVRSPASCDLIRGAVGICGVVAGVRVVELRRGRNRSLDGLLPVRRPVSVVNLVPLLAVESCGLLTAMCSLLRSCWTWIWIHL